MRFLHCGVVMSQAKVDTRGIGLIGTKSTPVAQYCQRKSIGEARTRKTHAYDDTARGHVFTCNLQPTAGCSAKVDAASGRFQERELLV